MFPCPYHCIVYWSKQQNQNRETIKLRQLCNLHFKPGRRLPGPNFFREVLSYLMITLHKLESLTLQFYFTVQNDSSKFVICLLLVPKWLFWECRILSLWTKSWRRIRPNQWRRELTGNSYLNIVPIFQSSTWTFNCEYIFVNTFLTK